MTDPATVGTLRSLHRYPVKSMLGESLDVALLGPRGIPGDRAWAIRDEARASLQGGKKVPQLMSCAARYVESPGAGDAPAPEIVLPSGDVFRANDPDAGKRLGEAVGREVSIWPIMPADDAEHYKRGAPDNPDPEAELRAIMAREPDEPLPDFGPIIRAMQQFRSGQPNYFDAFPLLILSERSLTTLAAAAPDSRIDVRRFRPNLVVATESDEPFPEQAWIGRNLRIGDAVLSVAATCPRCVMTTHAFADLPKDPKVMRHLVRQAQGNLGVYAVVREPAEVRAGDALRLLD
jgi:uncharacterized protein YcbX